MIKNKTHLSTKNQLKIFGTIVGICLSDIEINLISKKAERFTDDWWCSVIWATLHVGNGLYHLSQPPTPNSFFRGYLKSNLGVL